MKNLNTSRFLALLTASVLGAGVMFHPAPAHADKAKNYKYGAIALGAVGAYLLSKGKTVEGAAVLGAGAYTYKKGEDTRKADKDKYDDYRDRYNYRDRNNNRYPDPTPGRNRNDDYYDNYDDRYRVPARNRLGDTNNSSYRPYRNDDRDNRDRDNRDRDNRDSERYNRDHPKIRAR